MDQQNLGPRCFSRTVALAAAVVSIFQAPASFAQEDENSAPDAPAETEQVAPQEPAQEPVQEPVQEPAKEPSKAPAKTPAKDPKKGDPADAGKKTGKPQTPKIVEKSPEEKDRENDSKTPELVRNRLSLGVNLGLGWGKGTKEKDSTDHLGAEAYVSYLLPDSSPSAVAWTTEINYLSLTGVNKKFDESVVAQFLSVGGGIRFQLKPLAGETAGYSDYKKLAAGASERMSIEAVGLLGLSKRNGRAQATGRSIETKLQPIIGVNGRFLYQAWNKIQILTGLGVRAGGYVWIDGKLGIVASL